MWADVGLQVEQREVFALYAQLMVADKGGRIGASTLKRRRLSLCVHRLRMPLNVGNMKLALLTKRSLCIVPPPTGCFQAASCSLGRQWSKSACPSGCYLSKLARLVCAILFLGSTKEQVPTSF
jgi:hypothetical protein